MKKIVSYLVVLVVSLFTFIGFANASIDIPDGKKVVYIGRDTCGYCNAFSPIIEYLSKKYNFGYKYVDIEKISDEDYNEWMKVFGIEPDQLGTPTFGAFIDKQLVKKNEGYLPEENTFNFLKEAGVIDENAKYEPKYKHIKFISNDEYLDIIKSNKKSLIVLSQITNSVGIKSKDALEELGKKFNIDIYFYDLGFSSQEEFDSFVESNEYIEENIDTLTLPVFMVVKGSKSIDVMDASSIASKTYLEQFIKQNFKTDLSLILYVCVGILLAASITCNVVLVLKNKKCK